MSTKKWHGTHKTIRNEKTGEVTTYYIRFRTKQEKEDKIQHLFEKINPNSKAAVSKMKFIELFERWFRNKKAISNISENTIIMYEYAHKRCEILDDYLITSITDDDIIRILEEYKDKSNSALKTYIFLNQVFKYAVDHDYLLKNVLKLVPKPKLIKKEKRALSLDETKCLNAIINDLDPVRKMFLLIVFHYGLRFGEVCGLSKKDFDFTNNKLRVKHSLAFSDSGKPLKIKPTKNGLIRYIPLIDKDINFFKKYINSIPSDYNYIFYNEFSKRKNSETSRSFITKDTAEGILNFLMGKMNTYAEINYIELPANPTCHTFRHNFATIMVKEKGLKEAQYLLGDKTAKMVLEIYTHVEEDKLDLNDIKGRFGIEDSSEG